MKRSVVLFYLLLAPVTCLFAQKSFIISGTTGLIASGTVTLWKTGSEELYSMESLNDTVQVDHHRFQFKGTIEYPQQIRLLFSNTDGRYVTEPFFIDTGLQRITVDTTTSDADIKFSGFNVLSEGSPTNAEFEKHYLPLFDAVNKRIHHFFSQLERCDELTDSAAKKRCAVQSEIERISIRAIRDSILLDYSTRHPSSAIIPWQLSQSIWDYGYNDYYQRTLNQIRSYALPSITEFLTTYLGKQKSKAPGSRFPLADFITKNTAADFFQKNKYTLVEFWYSNCVPCLRQFKALRTIYNKHRKHSFGMVAVSTDGTESRSAYESILKKQDYPWNQVLDLGGVQTKVIDIHKFPTSFLLDHKGKIISVDIKPELLDDFLQKHLK